MITSLQNPQIKELVKLHFTSKERRKSDLFAVEGFAEISHAFENKFSLKKIFVCEDLLSLKGRELLKKLKESKSTELFYIDKKCFAKIAMRGESQGLVAIFKLTL